MLPVKAAAKITGKRSSYGSSRTDTRKEGIRKNKFSRHYQKHVELGGIQVEKTVEESLSTVNEGIGNG